VKPVLKQTFGRASPEAAREAASKALPNGALPNGAEVASVWRWHAGSFFLSRISTASEAGEEEGLAILGLGTGTTMADGHGK
jgi:hypothetical protein